MARSKTPPASKSKKSPTPPHSLTTLQRDVRSARVEYASLLKQMVTARREKTRGEDQYWELVGSVLMKKLYLLDDEASTADAWLDKHTGEHPRVARRNVRVAQVASPEEELHYGFTKIDLALAWRDAAERESAKKAGREWVAKEPPAPIDLEALRFKLSRAKKTVLLDLAAITTDELRALVVEKSRAQPRKADELTGTALSINESLVESELSEVKVSEHDAMITVGPFRADQAVAVGRVLVGTRAVSKARDESMESKPREASKPSKAPKSTKTKIAKSSSARSSSRAPTRKNRKSSGKSR